MLSPQESIKQKNSLNSPFFFFLFFLSFFFLLLDNSVYVAGLKHVTMFIRWFNYWWKKIFSVSLFFFEYI